MFGFNRILSRCLAISLILSVYGCSGGKSVQNKLAPDPRLVQPGSTSPSSSDKVTQPNNTLPTDFPAYPQAKLKSTEQTQDRATVTTWTTSDPIDLIYAFYQKELTAKQWQIVSQPSDSKPQLVAKKADVNVSIGIETSKEQQQTGLTVFNITLPPTADTSPSVAVSPPPTPTSKPSENKPEPAGNPDYIADLTRIGVLTSADTSAPTNKSTAPRSITRREYVRWLVAAYNRINSTKPTQQIKLATADTKPTFQDVPASHPDFPSIQGLAEAGLIPSPLSGDATEVLFRPETPVTREQLILWKVPLDTRQPLPTASLDAVKQTWGFQDAGKVEPKAIRAILADFQNGDRSNIRRVFGYTTLFQPKKTVNLGEVAATIWYFGANSEGLSARDAVSTN